MLKSVGNNKNPWVNQHYPQITHRQKSVGKLGVGNLPTKIEPVGN